MRVGWPGIQPGEEVGIGRHDARALGVAALVVALTLAGCGGGGGPPAAGPPGTPSPPTRARFISQADAVCQQARTALAGLATPTRALSALGDTPRAYAQAATLFRRVQSLEQGELHRLRALALPAGDNSGVTGYLRSGTRAVALIGRFADAFARREKRLLAVLTREGSRMAATTKGLAQGYGLKVCGHGADGNGLS